MKKVYLFKTLVLLFCFALLGCKKEDDADAQINFRVYGTVCDRATIMESEGAAIHLDILF